MSALPRHGPPPPPGPSRTAPADPRGPAGAGRPRGGVFGRFAADRRGNLPILFALTLLPMLGLLGLAVDYSMAMRAKTALDASTDAAVLAAATEAMQIIQTQSTANYDATPTAIAYGKIAGQNVFAANSAMVQTTATPTLNLSLLRPNNGLVITASGSYSLQWPTAFGKMFGTQTLAVGGRAASSLNLPKYMNIYLAADISQSMGIASTQTDMNNLTSYLKYFYSSHGRSPANATQQNGCVFGCHVTAPWQNSGDKSVEFMAHNPIDGYPAVTLRIDDVKQSFKNIIASANNLSNGTPTIKIGMYTLQEQINSDNTNYYNTISSPTTNYTNLASLADSLDLGNNDSGGTGDTDFPNAINGFATQVSASGDGSSSNSPQNFVFLVTDGVYDVKGSCTDGHCTKAFDPSLCTQFKNMGVTVGVIYTTYTQFPSEQTFVDLVQPFWSQISPNLQSCASPGYFYEASDGPSIQKAVNALFAQAVSSGKLTQ